MYVYLTIPISLVLVQLVLQLHIAVYQLWLCFYLDLKQYIVNGTVSRRDYLGKTFQIRECWYIKYYVTLFGQFQEIVVH